MIGTTATLPPALTESSSADAARALLKPRYAGKFTRFSHFSTSASSAPVLLAVPRSLTIRPGLY